MPNAVATPAPEQDEVVTSPPVTETAPVLEGEALDAALRTFIAVGGTEQFLYELGTGVQTVETLNLLYTGGGTTDTLEHREGPFPGGDQLANWAATNATAPVPDLDMTGPLTPYQRQEMQRLLEKLANGETLTTGQRLQLDGYVDRHLKNQPKVELKELNRMLDLLGRGIGRVPGGKAPGKMLDMYDKLVGLADKMLGGIDETQYKKFEDHMSRKPPGTSVEDYLNQNPFPYGQHLDRYITRWLMEQGRKQLELQRAQPQ